jgi:hypothetical protein
MERTRQFGACFLGLESWKRLELERFFEQTMDDEAADVPDRAWRRCWRSIASVRPAAN